MNTAEDTEGNVSSAVINIDGKLASHGLKIVFGSGDPLPLRGFPQGKARLRLRNDGFAVLWVRTENGIRKFYIKEEDGFWIPAIESASNTTTQIS